MSNFENLASASSAVVCDASACAVIYCCACLEHKPITAFEKYKVKCNCRDKNNGTCDECVADWIKKNNSCPNCRTHNNFKLRKITDGYELINHDFIFDFDIDPISENADRMGAKQYFLMKIDAMIALNKRYYNEVIKYIDEDYTDITRGQQLFLNIYNYMVDYVVGANYRNADVDDKSSLYLNDFVICEEVEHLGFECNKESLNNLKPFDFENFETECVLNSHNISVLVRDGNNRWIHYNFDTYTDDDINDRCVDEVNENIVYHDLSDIINHLKPEMRDAFNSNSPFWNFIRDDGMNDEVNALINQDRYIEYLVESGKVFEYIFCEGRSGYYERFEFEDYGNQFTETDRDDVYYCLIYQDTYYTNF